MINNKLPEKIENYILGLSIPISIQQLLTNEIHKSYYLGIENIEKIINRNILEVNPELIKFIDEYNFNLVKGINEDLANSLRKTLERNILENKPYTQITQEIKEIFDTTMERATMIARTETTRAFEMGQHFASLKAGIKFKKYWLIIDDNRTSDICRRLGRKYNIENAIDNLKNFRDDVTGASFLTPPAHINCFTEDTNIKTINGYRKIKDIQIGDFVLTHKKRFKKVTGLMNKEVKNYLEIDIGTNENHRILNVTEEHPILTPNGWKKAKYLTEKDMVLRW